ncbi:MAG: UDP-N-acetylmuramoyl-tripeptide--D-alanyl-D-alanine ligase [Clostridia bacterium]|nr:UDP-N-acetylmuramoyl-tripeptide--D-alanyl-D-alanine ligase [Clostridia bacterium]
MNLKIKDIINCTKGNLIIGNEEKECENFSKDTRTVKAGDTYIAIKGENFDGNLFWEDAILNGADTIIIEEINIDQEKLKKYNDLEKNIIKVKDTKVALKQIATAKRNLYDKLMVVGVTGSVGKTSTKDIIANVLSQKYKTLKTEGNNNNDIGLPFTILRLKDEEVAVIEMGMNHLGEISELTKIAKPTLSVITNVGTSHIGNLGSRENILKAKLEILEGMNKPLVVINNDNDLLHNWYEDHKESVNTLTFGINNDSNCMAKNIIKKENNSTFICNCFEECFEEKVPVGGEVFILNALCASLVAKKIGLSNDEIKNGISNFELTKKRMEISELKNGCIIINDSYNASFESMKASIEYLSNVNSNRKIAVLGDMFELGNYTEDLHRKVGREVVKYNIDKLLTIGDNAKYIMEEAINQGMNKDNVVHLNTKKDLIERIKSNIKKGDAILFKASNGMRLFDIVEKLKLDM